MQRDSGATATLNTIAVGRWSTPVEEPSAWVAWKLLEKNDDAVRIAVATWPKATFESWWATARLNSEPEILAVDPGPLPLLSSGTACTPDTWTGMDSEFPGSRDGHSMVWTGTEMLVWGGVEGAKLRDGWRYNPTTDTWSRMSEFGAPSGRGHHVAVWTGTEMIVWGGVPNEFFPGQLATGGRYNPSTDSWTTTALGPSWRMHATAVWSGSEMLVWGGENGSGTYYATGARYSPASNSWSPMNTLGAPSPRVQHTAVWTGNEMVVWGGTGSTGLFDRVGGVYKPGTDSWSSTSLPNFLVGRYYHSAVWTGSEMIIWGGVLHSGAYSDTGARYKPNQNTWTATTVTGAPTARSAQSVVWTGTRMLVWGGGDENGWALTGGSYDPLSDAWQPIASAGAPPAISTAVWTGARMIVWGAGPFGTGHDGGRYDPATNTWASVSSTWRPAARRRHVAVWTGAEMLIWGGYPAGIGYSSLDAGRYEPATDAWSPITMSAAPADRWDPSAVWSGTELLVWGGSVFDPDQGNEIPSNGGGRYNPVLDQWSNLATAGQPSPRDHHGTVWTGSEMIVWGGQGLADESLGDGARYRPATNAWTTMSAIGAPEPRHHHGAVWNGREMFVVEGIGYPGGLPGGARYDPGLDVWTPNSSAGAKRRQDGIARWSGRDVINALGIEGSTTRNTGDRYDPASDLWTPVTTLDTNFDVSGREAVWACGRLVVWAYNTEGGGRGRIYDPTANAWTVMSEAGAPLGAYHAAPVTDGTRLITFGGSDGSHESDTGGVYCACSEPAALVTPVVFVDKTPLGDRVSWYLQPDAAAYDVVRGELSLLRSSGGNFAAATTACVASDLSGSATIDGSVPGIGSGYFYVARSVRGTEVSTYDSGSPRQVGSRDSEIAASGAACP